MTRTSTNAHIVPGDGSVNGNNYPRLLTNVLECSRVRSGVCGFWRPVLRPIELLARRVLRLIVRANARRDKAVVL